MKYDWDLINTLFDVAEAAHGHPNLKAIEDAALAQLAEMCKPKEEPKATRTERDYEKR